jgi:hypothetical protein
LERLKATKLRIYLIIFKRPMIVGFYQYSYKLEDVGCVGMAYYNLCGGIRGCCAATGDVSD